MGLVMTYPCGCVNEVHLSGVLQAVHKCDHHMARYRDPTTIDGAYYAELAVLDGSALMNTAHVAELAEALGPIPRATGSGVALEVGCGVSPYVGTIRDAGWSYEGLDASMWAVSWTSDHWSVPVSCGLWEAWQPPHRYGLILAAHVLEHTVDAPASLAKMAGSLEPGGTLLVVVPDDSDPVNPDHTFFFTTYTLRGCAEAAGLTVDRLEIRRIVERENFIYLRARKS
jgi:2-polyprenyl-3-methyl-5-hydroxy-6-metoxy-1,4-benzoquinol methylase